MAKLDNTHKGIALAVIGPALWGIMGIFVRRLSAAGVGSTDISFLRCLLAGAFWATGKPEAPSETAETYSCERNSRATGNTGVDS